MSVPVVCNPGLVPKSFAIFNLLPVNFKIKNHLVSVIWCKAPYHRYQMILHFKQYWKWIYKLWMTAGTDPDRHYFICRYGNWDLFWNRQTTSKSEKNISKYDTKLTAYVDKLFINNDFYHFTSIQRRTRLGRVRLK